MTAAGCWTITPEQLSRDEPFDGLTVGASPVGLSLAMKRDEEKHEASDEKDENYLSSIAARVKLNSLRVLR